MIQCEGQMSLEISYNVIVDIQRAQDYANP